MTLDFYSTINQGASDEAWGISDLIIDALTNGSCEVPTQYAETCNILE